MKRARLYIGCTAARHRMIGIDAVVNARGGLQHLNEYTDEQCELERDGRAIRAKVDKRIRWYSPSSKFFRRNRARIAHLISDVND
jgi:hypothetical protein